MSAPPLWAQRLDGFDTETTAPDPASARLVSAAYVQQEAPSGADTPPSSEVRRWLVDPGVPIPAEASAVHGITDADVRGAGKPAEAVLDVLAFLASASRHAVPVVIMNAPYDLTLLLAEADRCRYGALARSILPKLLVLDPLVLDRHVDRYRRGKRTLTALSQTYGVDLVDAHDAAADVLASIAVTRRILRHPSLRSLSAAELHASQIAWHAEWAAGFKEWLARQPGRTGEDVDGRWPLR